MAELSRPIDKEFNVEVEGGRFSTSFLNDLVDTHVNKIAPRYIKFQKLYEGKHKIQNRPRKDKNKPNNKLVNDFFGQTIDNTVGYFLGNPIVLNYTEPKKDNKTLVEVGTYECHTAESSTTTAQLQPQKKNTTDLTLYTDPEAPIKRGDILYVYELDEYDKPIMSTEFKAIADKPYKKRTQLIVSLLSEEEV